MVTFLLNYYGFLTESKIAKHKTTTTTTNTKQKVQPDNLDPYKCRPKREKRRSLPSPTPQGKKIEKRERNNARTRNEKICQRKVKESKEVPSSKKS